MLDSKKQTIKSIIRDSLSRTLEPVLEHRKAAVKTVLSEAITAIPKVFQLRTEFLSNTTKELHNKLYEGYVETFNKVSAMLDSTPKTEINTNNSTFRHLKFDEAHNFNGIKFHELYFSNISDVHSEIRTDSLPFLRIGRDWGSFDNWQFDFRACGMCAVEGWAILYYEPYRQKYLNCFVERHTENVPVMGIPVLVIDTWHHAWFRDYPGDKLNYLNAMMREVNWDVVEARMIVAEQSNIHTIYSIQPLPNEKPQQILANVPTTVPPISSDQIVGKSELK